MTRRRPLAGERSRDRLGTAVLDLDRPVPEPATPAPKAPRPRTGRPDLVVVGAAVLAVALALTAALLALRVRGSDRTDTARTEAVAAAESGAVDVLSYDYRHLDRDFARAGKVLTGGFADDYRRTTDKVVRPTAEQVQAVVKADVVASSVVRAQQNRVVVLLFVNQTTTSNRLDAPKVDRNRVRMTMTRVDGNWLVSGVDAL